jgi:glutaminase
METQALKLSPLQRYIERLHVELLELSGGEVASYIPELTKADPSWLGIAVATVEGHVYQVGDSRQPFTVQSISKALTFGLALEDRGLDTVLSKISVEPSGEAFNSISLEPDTGRPLNPMINAGAIATTGLVAAEPDKTAMERIMAAFARYTGHPLEIDDGVYRSESATGHRNRAIAHLLFGHEILERDPDEVLDLYFRQCSALVTARDLALMGACLANNGVNPVTGVVALKSRFVEKVLSVMSSCGMYDFSGSWVFNVGMPAKSGVGGGIMAVLPGQFGLGVFSPPLDAKGNSVRGIEACKRFSQDFRLHSFQAVRSTSASVIRRVYDCKKFTSRRQRSAAEYTVLLELGEKIRIYELQGELLLGSSEAVSLEVLSHFSKVDKIILDLRRVVALDFASVQIFSFLIERARSTGKLLFFTECQHLYRFRRHIERDLSEAQEPHWLAFTDTDHAMQWCEDNLLDRPSGGKTASSGEVPLSAQDLCTSMSDEELAELDRIGERRVIPTGTRIFSAGDKANSMFFIFRGEVDVSVNGEGGQQMRVTTLRSGMVFGEVALLNKHVRTANVTTTLETDCLEVCFADLSESTRTKILVNMATGFAAKIQRDSELLTHLA